MSETRRDQEARVPVDVAPSRSPRRRAAFAPRAGTDRVRARRTFVWLLAVAATLVAVGVLVQAFSIAAYIRGAGTDALDLHQLGGAATHSIEIAVFVFGLAAWWGRWPLVALALALPVVGTIQVFLIGDTGEAGGWVNGLHGLLALVVFLLAVALAQAGVRSLRGRPGASGFEPRREPWPRGQG